MTLDKWLCGILHISKGSGFFFYILNWFLFCLSAFKLFSVFRLDQVVSENLKQLGVQLPQKAYQCAVHYFKRSVQQRDLHQLVSAFIVNDILAVWILYCVCFLQTRGWIVYIYILRTLN